MRLNEARDHLQINSPGTLTLANLVGAGDRLDKLSLALQAELLIKLSGKSDGYCPLQIARSTIQMVLNCERLGDDQLELYKQWKRRWQ